MTLYFSVNIMHVLGAIALAPARYSVFMLNGASQRTWPSSRVTAARGDRRPGVLTLTAVLLQPVSGGVLDVAVCHRVERSAG